MTDFSGFKPMTRQLHITNPGGPTATCLKVQFNKKMYSHSFTVEVFSPISRITAVGGYFQMSLTIHLAFQKHSCCWQCIMCERPRYVGLWGACNAFGAGNISCLEGKNCGPATAEISRIGLPALAQIPENYDSTVATMFKCPSSPLPGEPAHKMPITMFTVLVASFIIFSGFQSTSIRRKVIHILI